MSERERDFNSGVRSCRTRINLAAYHEAKTFMRHLHDSHEAKTGRKIKPIVCQVVEGAN